MYLSLGAKIRKRRIAPMESSGGREVMDGWRRKKIVK